MRILGRGIEKGKDVKAQSQRLHGVHCVLEALRARRREIHHLRFRRGSHRSELGEVLALAKSMGVPISELDEHPAAGLSRDGFRTQGVELEVGPIPQYSLEQLLAKAPRGQHRRLVLLDRVEDPQNVGSIARVAEAVAADGLVMTQRRAPPLGPAVARGSAGAIEWLPVARVSNLSNAIKSLKNKGFWSVGADPDGPESLFDLEDRFFAADLLFVLGAEGPGIRDGVGRLLDHRVRIPLPGHVASLNVAAAASVLLFEALRRTGANRLVP